MPVDDESAELLRGFMDAWNRRDVDELLALSDPEIVYVNSPTAVEPGTRHGHEGIKTVVTRQWELLGEAQVELEWLEARGGRIFGAVRIVRRMPGSEATVEVKGFASWTLRGGRVHRFEVLGAGTEFEEAMAKAGFADRDATG